MRAGSLLLMTGAVMATGSLAAPSPANSAPGMLLARDRQPYCASGKNAGCGEVYRHGDDCVAQCYGVCVVLKTSVRKEADQRNRKTKLPTAIW